MSFDQARGCNSTSYLLDGYLTLAYGVDAGRCSNVVVLVMCLILHQEFKLFMDTSCLEEEALVDDQNSRKRKWVHPINLKRPFKGEFFYIDPTAQE
ncbi:hypothetical protein Btru_028779 [Bulinus truncatus]|nr:hypothetical protein Btru_028779 [Bulinus truncatus]